MANDGVEKYWHYADSERRVCVELCVKHLSADQVPQPTL